MRPRDEVAGDAGEVPVPDVVVDGVPGVDGQLGGGVGAGHLLRQLHHARADAEVLVQGALVRQLAQQGRHQVGVAVEHEQVPDLRQLGRLELKWKWSC